MARRSKKGVDLFVIRDIETTAVDALAANAAATMVDDVIENVNSNEDYGSGSIKGLRADFVVKPEAVIEFPPRLVVMIIPSGMTVPAVTTAGQRKQNERFCWGDIIMGSKTDPSATSIWFATLHLKTARRFHSGDKLAIVIVNEDPAVSFGAAAVAYTYLKAYVTED